MGEDERRAAHNGKSSVVERRTFDRYDVEWSVDCMAQDDTFLFASITNIS